MRKSTGQLLKTTYTTDPLFIFHHINTYEEDGHVIMDGCVYSNTDVVYALAMDSRTLREGHPMPPAPVTRFVLPLDADTVGDAYFRTKHDLFETPPTLCEIIAYM